MERKSMGSFIAALRKANGYTQKELAEKLNVSDKAVSRWERDESAPDLTLLPVLAEIFEITTDELLCGERKTVKASADNDKPAPRTEKQLRRYLDTAMAKLHNLTLIPIILSACTVLTAVLVPNGYIALAIGTAISVIAIISEIFFLYNAHTSTVSEDFDEEKLSLFKKKTINFSKISFAISFYALYFLCAIDGFLVFTTGYYAEKYDQFRELFKSTHNIFSLDVLFIVFLYSVFAYILFNALWSAVMQILIKRRVYPADDKLKQTTKKKKYFFLIACLIASLTLYCGLNGYGSGVIDDFCSENIVKGKVFNDFNSFKEYIETPEELSDDVLVTGLTLGYSPATTAVWFDDESASNDEVILSFTDDNDNKICEFVERNENIGQYFVSDNGYPPITVYTYNELAQKSLIYRSFWTCILTAELIVAAIMYLILFKKPLIN